MDREEVAKHFGRNLFVSRQNLISRGGHADIERLGVGMRHPKAVCMQLAWILLNNFFKWEAAADSKKRHPNSSLDLIMDLQIFKLETGWDGHPILEIDLSMFDHLAANKVI